MASVPAIRFTPTEADYVAASRANYIIRWRSWPRMCGLLIAAALGMLGGGVLGYVDAGRIDGFVIRLALFYGGCVIAGIILGGGASLLLLPLKTRRMFAQQPAYREPMTFEWSDEAVAFESVLSRTRIGWVQLFRSRETRRDFLLYLSDTVFLFVPKRALTDEQAADLRIRLRPA